MSDFLKKIEKIAEAKKEQEKEQQEKSQQEEVILSICYTGNEQEFFYLTKEKAREVIEVITDILESGISLPVYYTISDTNDVTAEAIYDLDNFKGVISINENFRSMKVVDPTGFLEYFSK